MGVDHSWTCCGAQSNGDCDREIQDKMRLREIYEITSYAPHQHKAEQYHISEDLPPSALEGPKLAWEGLVRRNEILLSVCKINIILFRGIIFWPAGLEVGLENVLVAVLGRLVKHCT